MARLDIDEAKQRARERIWALLESKAAAPAGVYGRIPAFFGAKAAADRLATLPVWRAARTVKAVPDKAQLPVRARALTEGKLVYMAVPRLADALPFFLLDPASLTVPPEEAASSHVAETVARKVGVEEMQPVDLIICGSVAVNRHGVRLGKGAGYSDISSHCCKRRVCCAQRRRLSRPCTPCRWSTSHCQKPATTSAST